MDRQVRAPDFLELRVIPLVQRGHESGKLRLSLSIPYEYL